MSLILLSLTFLSGVAFSTQQASCGAFEVEHGSVDFSHPSGIIAIVTCDKGHLADAGTVLTCVESLAKWTAPIPKCKVWYCDITELERTNQVRIVNSALEFKSKSETYRGIQMGGYITLACENNLEKKGGYETVSCAQPQRWSLPPLYCKSYCKKLTVTNGKVNMTDEKGLAKTTCDRGYKIKGPPILKCDRETRSWDAKQPECEPDMSYCATNKLEEEYGVKILSTLRGFTSHDGISGVQVNGMLALACKPGYTKKSGASEIRCKETDRFDQPILKCKEPTDAPEKKGKPKNKNGRRGGNNGGGNGGKKRNRNKGKKNKQGKR